MNGFASSSPCGSPTTSSTTRRGVAELAELARARRARLVPRENLHVTLAFLGSRPAGELAGDRRACSQRPRRGARRSSARASPATARRGASGCSSSTTTGGRGAALAGAAAGAARAELGVYEPEARAVAAARHRAPLPRAAAAPAAAARARTGCSVRCGCFTYPVCTRPGRGTRSSNRRARIVAARRLIRMNREEALDVALGQIERQFGKGSVMKMSDQAQVSDRRDLDRLALARPRARHRRAAARPRGRDLRPGVLGQDDARLPRDRRGAAPRRHLRLHRRRARDGPAVRAQDRRQRRRPAGLAARHGRAGARDHRAARPLRRARRRRGRLGRRADAEGRDRGRDGRHATSASRRG